MLKKIVYLIIVVLILLLLAGFAVYQNRSSLIASRIDQSLESLLGVPVSVGTITVQRPSNFRLSPLKITIDKITLDNPPGFPTAEMVVVEKIELSAGLWALLKKEWQIADMSAELSHVNVIVDRQGESNLSHVSALKEFESPAGENFFAQRFQITFGRIDYYDQSSSAAEPETFDMKQELNVYQALRDPKILIQAPALKIVYFLEKGGLGIRRGKIQENIAAHSGVTV